MEWYKAYYLTSNPGLNGVTRDQIKSFVKRAQELGLRWAGEVDRDGLQKYAKIRDYAEGKRVLRIGMRLNGELCTGHFWKTFCRTDLGWERDAKSGSSLTAVHHTC